MNNLLGISLAFYATMYFVEFAFVPGCTLLLGILPYNPHMSYIS